MDRENLRKGFMYSKEEITEQCNAYLKDILTLYFWEDDDDDSKGYKLNGIFEKNSKESFIEGYQRLLHRSLILDPLTERDVRKNLLSSHDRVCALRATKKMMKQDDLDTFFDDMKKDQGLWMMEINYLKEKISYAVSEFYDAEEQDFRFKNIIEKLKGDGDNCWDHKYIDLWNKKLAGQIRTAKEHIFIVNNIIDSFTEEELKTLHLLPEFHGLIWAKIDAQYENMVQQEGWKKWANFEKEVSAIEDSPERRKTLLNLYAFIPKSFFTRNCKVCYPWSSIDVSLANVLSRYYTTDPYMPWLIGKQITHIDIEEHAIKNLQRHWYTALHDDITTHGGKYDFVFDSRSQVLPEHIDNLVNAWWYVLVENAHAHANYFYDSPNYRFIANICNGEEIYSKVEMDNPFSSWDKDYYLFKKFSPSKNESFSNGVQMKLDF